MVHQIVRWRSLKSLDGCSYACSGHFSGELEMTMMNADNARLMSALPLSELNPMLLWGAGVGILVELADSQTIIPFHFLWQCKFVMNPWE
jgi:hypothetical protein